MLCPHCSNENREGAKFCDECGARLHACDLEALSDSEIAESSNGDERRANESAQGSSSVVDGEDAEMHFDNRESADEPIALCEPMDGNCEAEVNQTPDSDISIPYTCDKEIADEAIAECDLDGALEPEQALATPASEFDMTADETAPLMSANLAGFDKPSEGYGEIIAEDAYHASSTSRDGHTKKLPCLDVQEVAEGGDEPKEFKSQLPEAKKKRCRNAIVGVVVIALVAGMIAFGTYEAQLWGGKVIPDVTNMTEADARSMLGDAGFKVKTREIKSDDTEGLVVITDPAAGIREDEGAEIVIHIATSREIPDVMGKTKKEAKAALSAEGYENVKFKKEKSDEEKGSVVSIAPKPGTACKSTAKVVVKIATPYVVPDINGLDVDNAGQTIIDAGLSYDVEEVETEGYEDGAIIGTVPESGAEVKKGSLVMIQIAKVRGPVLESLTIDYLDPGSEVTIGGISYVVDTVESVQYAGNDTVDYVITARPYTHLLGQKLTGSKRRIEGSIVWTDDNKISEIS